MQVLPRRLFSPPLLPVKCCQSIKALSSICRCRLSRLPPFSLGCVWCVSRVSPVQPPPSWQEFQSTNFLMILCGSCLVTGMTDDSPSHCFSPAVHPAVNTLPGAEWSPTNTLLLFGLHVWFSCLSFIHNDQFILVYVSRQRLPFPAFNNSFHSLQADGSPTYIKGCTLCLVLLLVPYVTNYICRPSD